ncbi:MAG: HepT-like ribonuclease domain-containing protein, partial [Bacteroidota bacterium]
AIIGEAAFQLRRNDFRFAGQDQLINRRNTLVHQYDAARPANLWNYITYKLPELQQILSEFPLD